MGETLAQGLQQFIKVAHHDILIKSNYRWAISALLASVSDIPKTNMLCHSKHEIAVYSLFIINTVNTTGAL